MRPLSDPACKVLTALADDDQAVVLTIRPSSGGRTSVRVGTRGNLYDKVRRFHVPPATFHTLHRAGLLARTRGWQAFGQTYMEYELTDAGRAALETYYG